MGRIIVNNNSSLSDDEGLAIVIDCIRAGRISNHGKQYCYASKYSIGGHKVLLTTELNKNSDSFTIKDSKVE